MFALPLAAMHVPHITDAGFSWPWFVGTVVGFLIVCAIEGD